MENVWNKRFLHLYLVIIISIKIYHTYFMEHKSEVTEKIQDYVRSMKNKFGKIPKIIKSDRGREYVNI